MVNNLTFMGFTALFAFMLFFGAAVDNQYAKEDRKLKLSIGAFIDKKVAEYHSPVIKKGEYKNNQQKLAYLWSNNNGK